MGTLQRLLPIPDTQTANILAIQSVDAIFASAEYHESRAMISSYRLICSLRYLLTTGLAETLSRPSRCVNHRRRHHTRVAQLRADQQDRRRRVVLIVRRHLLRRRHQSTADRKLETVRYQSAQGRQGRDLPRFEEVPKCIHRHQVRRTLVAANL